MSETKVDYQLTPSEAAALMGLNVSSLTAYRSRGTGLPYIKRGGRIYYRQSDVMDYVKGKLIIPGDR